MTIDPDPNDHLATGPKPEPITAKSLGYFNLIFGILFILETAFEAGLVLAMPSFGVLMSWANEQQQEQQDRIWDARRANFEKQLEDAEDDDQREVIEAEQTLAEMNLPGRSPWLGFSLSFLDTPSLRAGVLAKLGVMLALNGMLIASGIGLIRLRGWGRTTARLAAILLIPATIAFSVLTARAVPGMTERWTAEMQEVLFQETEADGLPEGIVDELDRYEQGMERLFLASVLLSSGLMIIYPVVVFVVASRPGVGGATGRRVGETDS